MKFIGPKEYSDLIAKELKEKYNISIDDLSGILEPYISDASRLVICGGSGIYYRHKFVNLENKELQGYKVLSGNLDLTDIGYDGHLLYERPIGKEYWFPRGSYCFYSKEDALEMAQIFKGDVKRCHTRHILRTALWKNKQVFSASYVTIFNE